MSISRIRPSIGRLLPSRPALTRPSPATFRVRPATNTLALRPLHTLPRRPHLPSTAPNITLLRLSPQHPRHVSSSTKSYLKSQAHLALQVVFYGYAAIFLLTWLAYGCIHWYLEAEQATPEEFPFWVRDAMRNARANVRWGEDWGVAGEYLRMALEELEKEKEKGGLEVEKARRMEGWKRAYLGLLWELLEYEIKAGKFNWARTRLDEVLGINWIDDKERSKASVRLGNVLEMLDLDDKDVLKALEEGVRYAIIADNIAPSAILGVIPEGVQPSPELTNAATELAIFHARRHALTPALPIFLSILRARESTNKAPLSDPCEESKLMAYIGEILYASGSKAEGMKWNSQAIQKAFPLAELRRKCKECAMHAVRNEITMLKKEGASPERVKQTMDAQKRLKEIRATKGE